MKKTILIAAIVSLFSASAAVAQDAPKKERSERSMNNRRGAMWDDPDLNLTKDQKDKLKAQDEDNWKQMKALRDDSSLSDDQKKDKMKEMRTKQKEAREKILTKEQVEKLNAKMKERMERGRNRQAQQ
ncbi:hypothetical protein [Niabella drilacis]|uniref:LTXXQ motif family protein n=1 Tax=Niabella drilacis (strain DSM 25811 / CCM 8410 / CCUG 62505 / LMG 26954 / E90) TaxID=1285928 RepID=A0A1G7ABQ8_NIADE|nr:hypothetical protein [Niabella drilacis]SDE12344.1 hypothetical protein SAMN04487894_12239 [Niabella drilacis]